MRWKSFAKVPSFRENAKCYTHGEFCIPAGCVAAIQTKYLFPKYFIHGFPFGEFIYLLIEVPYLLHKWVFYILYTITTYYPGYFISIGMYSRSLGEKGFEIGVVVYHFFKLLIRVSGKPANLLNCFLLCPTFFSAFCMYMGYTVAKAILKIFVLSIFIVNYTQPLNNGNFAHE